MEQTSTNASDGSVQEIVVHDRNPVDSAQTRGKSPVAPEPAAASSLLTDQQEASTIPGKIQSGMVAVALLHPYAKNAEIYQQRVDPEFEESIRVSGVLTPLVVTEDGETIGGNRRLEAAKKAGIAEVPVRVIVCKTEDDKLRRVIDDNRYRRKTNVEETREYMARKAIESREAQLRKVEAGRKHGKPGEEVKTVAPAPSKKGKARELASAGSGLTGVSLEKGCKVVEAADKLRKEGDEDTAAALLAKLDKGFASALSYAQSLNLIEKPQPKARKGVVDAQAPGRRGAGAPAAKSAPTSQPPPTDDKPADSAPFEVAAPKDGDETDEADAMETQHGPSAGSVIESCGKLGDELDALDVGNLMAAQKRDLFRVLDRVADWLAHHDEMLQAPALK